MNGSLNDIASQVLNAVLGGLKGPHNFSMSLEQLKDEFGQYRNRFIQELAQNNILNPEQFRQSILKLPVVKKDFANVAGVTTTRKVFWAEIPELLHINGVQPIAYVSVMDKTVYPFKVVYGNDIFYLQHETYSKNKPTIWVEDRNFWLLNPPVPNIQNVTFRALLDNPRAINGVAGQKFTDDDTYPMPGNIVSEIRDKMVWDYIKQYRMTNPQPTLMAGDLTLNQPQSNRKQ